MGFNVNTGQIRPWRFWENTIGSNRRPAVLPATASVSFIFWEEECMRNGWGGCVSKEKKSYASNKSMGIKGLRMLLWTDKQTWIQLPPKLPNISFNVCGYIPMFKLEFTMLNAQISMFVAQASHAQEKYRSPWVGLNKHKMPIIGLFFFHHGTAIPEDIFQESSEGRSDATRVLMAPRWFLRFGLGWPEKYYQHPSVLQWSIVKLGMV